MSADDKVTLTIVRVQKLGKQVGQITPALIFADVTDIPNPWTLPPPPTLPGKVIVWRELATNVQDFDLVQTQDFPGGFSGSRGVLVGMKIPAIVLFWQGRGGNRVIVF